MEEVSVQCKNSMRTGKKKNKQTNKKKKKTANHHQPQTPQKCSVFGWAVVFGTIHVLI